MATGKTIALTIYTFVGQVISPLFNMRLRFLIAFLPRSKLLLISWPQSQSSVILEPKKRKSITVSIFPHFYLPWSNENGYHDLRVFNVVLSQLFHVLLSLSSRGSLVPLHFMSLEWYYLHIWGYWHFSWRSWFQPVTHPAQHFTWYTLHIS